MRCWITCNKRWVSGRWILKWKGSVAFKCQTRPPETRCGIRRTRVVPRSLQSLICPPINCSFYFEGWKIFGVKWEFGKECAGPSLAAWKLTSSTWLDTPGRGPRSEHRWGSRKLALSLNPLSLLLALADHLTLQSLLKNGGNNNQDIRQLIPC